MATDADDPAFAHPIERELAQLYDRYGIVWEYEPHTIVLERHEDGSVREAFTPDFYLPELDVYVECTVARQSLTHRKRRKARRAREHAGVSVGILFRRDFQRLAQLFRLRGLEHAARGEQLTFGHPRERETRSGAMDQAWADNDPGDFRIDEETPRPGIRLLAVHGEADLHTAPELRERLGSAIDDGAQRIVLDLTETTFLDSMSLGVLLGAMKRMRARQGELRLVVSRPDVRRIFEITLLDRVFPIDETASVALDAIADPSVDVVEGREHADDGVDGRDLENPADARVRRND
jgi:anti-sigma B factor antagonist